MAEQSTPPGSLPIAWEPSIAAHDRRVLLLLLAMGLRIDQAKEIAQATWMRLFEQQQSGRLPRVELPGLALRQARFLALDELRRQGRSVELSAIEPELESGAPSAETTLIQRQELERALAALERCSPSARRVFLAVYEAPEASHADAAQRLGLSIQRVRQVLCEVRKRLRQAMEPSEVSDD